MLLLAILVPGLMSCHSEDFDTNQFRSGVYLNSFGPSPVARGGELRFIGSGMDQITRITIPGCDDITEITVINSGEIRIKVPQEAQPGYLELHHAGGVIKTGTMLTFLEPISIESITPERVKPGSELTIKGDYLNLINEVCFSFLTDSVNVYAEEFLAHDRKTITLKVPEEAVTGTIYLSDAKELPNMIESEQEVAIVLPSVDKLLDLTNARAGQKVTVTGHDFDLVRHIEMPDGTEVEFKYESGDNAETLTFNLTDNATDGAVVAIPASGVKVGIANIGMVLPTELVADPATGIRGGQVITITGVNMDQIKSVRFPGVDEDIVPELIEPTRIKVAFPEMGKSGAAIIKLKNGKSVEIELSTLKPEILSFNPNPVSAGSTLTITGKNLDLAVALTFANDVEMKVTPTADEIKINVPADAASGIVNLKMANGETAKSETALQVTAPECCNIISLDSPLESLVAGQVMIAIVANADKLTGVEVNGAAVHYLLNGNKLYINLPSTCGKGTKIRLISSNGEITHVYDITPATHVENEIFNGSFELKNWDSGGFRIYKESLRDLPAGAKLVFHTTSPAAAQIQINDANWGQIVILEVAAGKAKTEFELTADILKRVLETGDGWSETAIVVNGHTATITKIVSEYERSMETEIWKGKWSSGNWSGNQDLAWDGFDWNTTKTGQKVRIYVTPEVANPSEDWWCVAVRHGKDWGALPAPVPDQWGQPVDGVVEFSLTADVRKDLIENGGLVITGASYTLTKVTIE